jgi:hypothetical protein
MSQYRCYWTLVLVPPLQLVTLGGRFYAVVRQPQRSLLHLIWHWYRYVLKSNQHCYSLSLLWFIPVYCTFMPYTNYVNICRLIYVATFKQHKQMSSLIKICKTCALLEFFAAQSGNFFLTLEDGNNALSRNVGNNLTFYIAWSPKRTHISFTPQWKPEITQKFITFWKIKVKYT